MYVYDLRKQAGAYEDFSDEIGANVLVGIR